MGLSVLNFEGRIKLIDSKSAPDDPAGIKELLGLNTKCPVVGFDTESKPKALYSQTRNPTALIQLASENVCVLWRTVGTKKLPKSLLSILADPGIVKVGQGVGLDVRDMKQDFTNISEINNIIDLHKVASSLNCQPKSLQGLVGLFLKRRLLKDMRISNWESEVLRAEQIHYAAIDAWSARAVFLEMKNGDLEPEKIGKIDTINLPSDTNTERESSVYLTVPPSVSHTPVVNRSAQVELVEICVKKGYILRLSGFEKESFGDKFKCVFEITKIGSDPLRMESARSHSSIRAAQEDAASVALEILART